MNRRRFSKALIAGGLTAAVAGAASAQDDIFTDIWAQFSSGETGEPFNPGYFNLVFEDGTSWQVGYDHWNEERAGFDGQVDASGWANLQFPMPEGMGALEVSMFDAASNPQPEWVYWNEEPTCFVWIPDNQPCSMLVTAWPDDGGESSDGEGEGLADTGSSGQTILPGQRQNQDSKLCFRFRFYDEVNDTSPRTYMALPYGRLVHIESGQEYLFLEHLEAVMEDGIAYEIYDVPAGDYLLDLRYACAEIGEYGVWAPDGPGRMPGDNSRMHTDTLTATSMVVWYDGEFWTRGDIGVRFPEECAAGDL